MKALVDISVVPLGVGLSLSRYIAECERIFQRRRWMTKCGA
jgi:uncharacterized protein YqgV (UPF0045/DUF77 family)